LLVGEHLNSNAFHLRHLSAIRVGRVKLFFTWLLPNFEMMLNSEQKLFQFYDIYAWNPTSGADACFPMLERLFREPTICWWLCIKFELLLRFLLCGDSETSRVINMSSFL